MADAPRTLYPVTTEPDEGPESKVDPSCDELFEDYAKDGEHVEYQAFEKLVQAPWLSQAGIDQRVLGTIGMQNVWDFLDDALNGTGGFSDGSYLQPHAREFNPQTKRLDVKFYARMAIAQYDNFVKPIAETPWNYISQMRDAIERKTHENLPQDLADRLEEFWQNADGRGTEITDFMEYPAGQARRYGTGWIVVDRPSAPLVNASADAMSPVYAYCVPTRDVVHWTFDDDFRLSGVVIKEPWAETLRGEDPPFDVRVWTKSGWALYRGADAKSSSPDANWQVVDAGPNDLGEVPIVQMFDEDPGPGKGFGRTVIPTIARMALTCFNQRSEIREIQRNTGFPFLAVPMRDAQKAKDLTLGTENILGYDGTSGGPPNWVTQALTEAAAIREDMDKNKDAAFAMSHMNAIVSWTVQTTSGFHAETEFDKTNRRIGKFAASAESAENKVARLVLKYHGLRDDVLVRKAVTVAYPRDFGLRDVQAVQDRIQKRLDMVLGEDDAASAIEELYTAQYPREDKDELKARAEAAAAARYKATGGGPAGATATIPEAVQKQNEAAAKQKNTLAPALTEKLKAALLAKKAELAGTGTQNGSAPPNVKAGNANG